MLTETQRMVSETQRMLTDAQRMLTDAQRMFTDAQRMLTDAQRMLTDAQRMFTDAQRMLRDAQRMLTDAQRMLRDAQRMLTDAQRMFTDAQRMLRDAQRRLRETRRTGGIESFIEITVHGGATCVERLERSRRDALSLPERRAVRILHRTRMDRLGLASLLLLATLAPGCAAWEDHNKKTLGPRVAFEEGRFEESLALMKPFEDDKLDGLCFKLDAGVVSLVGGMLDHSNDEFQAAEDMIQGFEDRGLNGSVIAEEIGSIAVNEKTIPYKGEDFERVLVPCFRARDYLIGGKLDDAMVEVRKIWTQQDLVKQLRDKEIKESNDEAANHKIDSGNLGDYESQVTYPPGALKSPESVYEVTYAHWLSAMVSEKKGLLDDAWISLQKASKIRPDVKFVARDLLRVATLRGRAEDVDEVKKTYGDSVTLPGADEGSVVLLFDCGWAPHKRELKIFLPSFSTFGAIAIPLYDRTPNPVAYARLWLNERNYPTEVLSDVDAIAFKYHHGKLATTILKQILRTTIKIAASEAAAAATRRATGSGLAGLGVGLVGGIYNDVSEQADLRAWLTLPQNFQAVRAWAPAGTYDAKIELVGFGGGTIGWVPLGQVTVKPKSIQFAQARSLGTRCYASMCKEAP
jgi:hypothetical protein